jgi:homoserine dehydrogenase
MINRSSPYWIDLDTWQDNWQQNAIPTDWEALENILLKFKSWYEELLKKGNLIRNNSVVIVDCTSSEEVTQHYHKWATLGIHIVAANKKFFSGPIDEFRNFFQVIRENRVSCHFEATVGAGLPLIAPLRNFIVKTGDNVLQIEGISNDTNLPTVPTVLSFPSFPNLQRGFIRHSSFYF